MHSTTILASVLATAAAVSAQNTTTTVTATATTQLFNPACYPTLPGGGYTYGSDNPFPSPTKYGSNGTTSTTVTTYVASVASTGIPVPTTNGIYTISNATSTYLSTVTPSGSSVNPGTTTATTAIGGYSASSAASSSNEANVSAAATSAQASTGAGATLESGIARLFALGVAAVVLAVAL